MLKKTLITLTLVLLGGTSLYLTVVMYGSEAALYERHPSIDRKVVKKAHRRLVRAAMRGELKDVDTNDDEAMDRIFLGIVRTM
jgi:tRNA A37 N6-isopentenylltransferase MiaA